MGSDSELSMANVVEKPKEPRRFHCSYDNCLSAFNRQWKLDRHICTHTKERPFKCNFPGCEKDYTSKSHLQRHISVSHNKKNNVVPTFIPCPFLDCHKQFQNKYSLKKHCKRHDNSYKCTHCDLVFKKRRQLLVHSIQHGKSSNFISCTKCNEIFLNKKSLTKHERTHRVYKCEYENCGEEFAVWSLLRTHFKLKHTLYYVCDFCKRSYINKNTLTKHIATHLPEDAREVFPCPFKDCLRYYKYKRNLNQHIMITHHGKRFECKEENCNKTFTSKRRFLDHQLRHKVGNSEKPRKVTCSKKRKPRRDKGRRHKSMAATLSGIILPLKVHKCLTQNALTPEAEERIQQTIEILKAESVNDSSESNEAHHTNLSQCNSNPS